MGEDFVTQEYVYVIGNPDEGTVKIGRTSDLRRRLGQIERMSLTPVEVLWFTAGGAPLEAALHDRLSACRSHGEWFKFESCAEALRAVVEASIDILTGPPRKSRTTARPTAITSPPVEVRPPLQELDARVLGQLHEEPVGPGAITSVLGVSRDQVKRSLIRLAKRGQVASPRHGHWIRLP